MDNERHALDNRTERQEVFVLYEVGRCGDSNVLEGVFSSEEEAEKYLSKIFNREVKLSGPYADGDYFTVLCIVDDPEEY